MTLQAAAVFLIITLYLCRLQCSWLLLFISAVMTSDGWHVIKFVVISVSDEICREYNIESHDTLVE